MPFGTASIIRVKFVSYAFRDLSRKKIVKYALHYEGVDMARLMGADEENFPFLMKDGDHYDLLFWNVDNGMLNLIDEDPVRGYATVLYLRENAYPVFASDQEAETWAREHDWPRKPRPGHKPVVE